MSSAGFAIAYPVNVWMVARGMKHGLMTERAEAAAATEPRGMNHVGMKMAGHEIMATRHEHVSR